MLNPWVSLAVYQTEMLISFLFFSAVFSRPLSGGRCLLAGFLLFAVGSAVNLLGGNNGVLNSLVTTFLNSLFACLCFRSKTLPAIFYSCILTIINAALEISVITLFSAVIGSGVLEHNSNFPLLVVECSVCKGLYFLITLLLARMVRPGSQAVRLKGNLFFFPVAATVCQIISWYILVQPDTSGETQNLLAVSSALLLFATVLLFITYQDQLRRDGEAMQLKSELARLQTEASYFQLLERQNEELMLYAHDAKKHLAAIQSLNEDPQVGAYAEKLSQQLANYSRGCHSGNKLLDVMIHKYSIDCEKRNIRFEYDVRLSSLSRLEDIDLVAVLGNLIDNAMTAAEHSEGKWLSLATGRRNFCDILIVSNSCDTPPQSSGGRLISTKTDAGLHGYGLRSVERALKKYQGDHYLDYDSTKKAFTATVMIPLKAHHPRFAERRRQMEIFDM